VVTKSKCAGQAIDVWSCTTGLPYSYGPTTRPGIFWCNVWPELDCKEGRHRQHCQNQHDSSGIFLGLCVHTSPAMIVNRTPATSWLRFPSLRNLDSSRYSLLIRRFLCGHPDPFRSVRDLGCVPASCSCSSGIPEGCSSRWLPAWLPRKRVHGSGGRLPNLANLCFLPAWTRSLVSETARFIPRIFRIMETGPVTASRRSRALMSDPDDRDADHPGLLAGRQAVVRLVCHHHLRARARMTSLEGVWRTVLRAVELETLMLVSSRGLPLLTMVNGPLMAWRSWPDGYRPRPVRAAATTSAPWCCSPFWALPGAFSAWPLSGWTRPLLPPTRLLPNPGTDGFCQGRLRVYMNHAPLTGSGCPTVTDGLDRFRESQILLRRVGGRPPTFPPACSRNAVASS
jgi:hypothetical protein